MPTIEAVSLLDAPPAPAPCRPGGAPFAELRERILDRRARVAVIGLGYVGLPLSLTYCHGRFRTMGLDIDSNRIETLRRSRSPIGDVTAGEVEAALRSGLFTPTDAPSALADADCIIICVPTPLRKTREPDISAIIAACRQIGEHLRPGRLVVLESTTYPGTTDEVIVPILSESGLEMDEDFFVAFSPERVDPGSRQFNTRTIPKIVGGVTARSTELAHLLYSQVVDQVVPVSNARVAETAKLLENTFRSVNIALVNELALMCQHLGVDVWEVIEAAATKPFGFIPHYPGPGIGGHCIPLDPLYLSWKARLNGFEARFISLAAEVNGAMPRHVVRLVMEALNSQQKALNGARVLLIGVTYKRDVEDLRESPALEILAELRDRGAVLGYHDPYVPSIRFGGMELASESLEAGRLAEKDCVVIITDHSAVDYRLIVDSAPLVVDTRNATRGLAGAPGSAQIVRL
jgi:UDP-N-acetyl-D-glucosamine dehydrogenase